MTTVRVKDLIAKLVDLDNSEAEVFVSDAETDASYGIDAKTPVVPSDKHPDRVYLLALITSEEDVA